MVQIMVLGMLLYLMVLSLSLMRTTSCVDHARMSGQAAVYRTKANLVNCHGLSAMKLRQGKV